VKRLGGKHGIDRCIGDGDLLRRPGERYGIRAAGNEKPTHLVGRLDSDDSVEFRDEEARQLPGAGTEIKHARC
jgi:hypothetical protein